MSEINLNEEVTVVVEDAQVITTPIDDTLTISGDAADAKAVGDALALKADASSVTAISVNGQTADNQGAILINGTEIPMSDTDQTTLKAAIDTVDAKTGATIPVNGDENAVTIEQAIANAAADSASVTGNVLQLGGSITDNSDAMEGLAIGAKTLPVVDPNAVRSVNNTLPGSGGNVQITTVDVARQLQTDNAQVIEGIFIERPTGGSTNVGDGDAWLSVVRGNSVHTGVVEESFTLTVTSASANPITAEITTKATFRTKAGTAGTYTFTYTTAWDNNPSEWGITVTGTPTNGDVITVVWVAEDRGTITPSYPSAFNATNWNLYNHTVGYARVLKYSDEYNFKISGTYTSIAFATTITGTQTTITPVNGVFSIQSDGYVFVEGGNNTSTAIWMQWSDWTENYAGSFKAHDEEDIDLSTVMSTYFENGLCSVGSVRDEININIGKAIQRIERMAYSEENLAAVIAAGRAYDADENYIYAVLETEVTNDISVDGAFTASDHGMEYFDTTTVGAYAQILYGENLVDKLRTDVVQISAQSLTSTQKNQVRANIGAPQTSHASTATTYGVGNASNYGHTKLSDTYASVSSSQKAANSVAASAWALQTAYSKCAGLVTENWGTSLTVPGTHALIMVGGTTMIQVWCSSTTNISASVTHWDSSSPISGFYKTSSGGTISFSATSASGSTYTLTRDGSSFTLTCTLEATMTAIYAK